MQNLKHNPNGRFVVVCGDGEYIIYTALAWRNRSFGSALEFVWSSDGEYAVRESTSKIKIFSKNFQVLADLVFFFWCEIYKFKMKYVCCGDVLCLSLYVETEICMVFNCLWWKCNTAFFVCSSYIRKSILSHHTFFWVLSQFALSYLVLNEILSTLSCFRRKEHLGHLFQLSAYMVEICWQFAQMILLHFLIGLNASSSDVLMSVLRYDTFIFNHFFLSCVTDMCKLRMFNWLIIYSSLVFLFLIIFRISTGLTVVIYWPLQVIHRSTYSNIM